MLILPTAISAAEEAGAPSESLYQVKENEENPFLPTGSEPQITATSYRSENVSVTLTFDRLTVTSKPDGKKEYKNSSSYVVADIYIRDITSLRRVFAKDKFGSTSDRIASMAEASGAVLAVNGDYSADLSCGVVVANGAVKRKTSNKKRDMLVILRDGTCEIIPYGTGKTWSAMLESGLMNEDTVWQCFLFGPNLLEEDGSPCAYKDMRSKTDICPANPRTVFGYYEPGHYCIVVADGRTSESIGLRLEVIAQLMSDLGCRLAYNLDGGQSSQMWFGGSIQNKPYKNGRRVNDALIICEPQIP